MQGIILAGVGVLLILGWLNRKGNKTMIAPLYRIREGLSPAEIRQQFVDTVKESGLLSYLESKFPSWDINAILAICAQETGWLSDPNAKDRIENHYNIMGLDKAGQPDVPRDYSTYEECLDYFHRLITKTPRYAPVLDFIYDGPNFLEALHHAGYNSNESWYEGVLNIYEYLITTMQEYR